MHFPRREFLSLSAGLLSSLCALAPVRADESRDIAVTLPSSAAVDLREQLANARGPSALEVLTLEGVADFEPVVPVPMRDGVRLSANIILPRGSPAQKLPVILIRTPYTPAAEVSEALAPPLLSRSGPQRLCHRHRQRSGHAVVRRPLSMAQGRQSGRQRHPGLDHEAGVVERQGRHVRVLVQRRESAAARHDQSSGPQGHGGNGRARPPTAASPVTTIRAFSITAECLTSRGRGGITASASRTIRSCPPDVSQDTRARIAASFSPEPSFGMIDFLALASHLPSADILSTSGVPTTEWDRLIRLTPASPEWKEFDFVRDGDRTQVPGLHIDSWYDVIEAYPTVKLFQYLSGNSPNQHLVMGPTAHCRMGTETEATSVGDRTVGDGRFDYVTMITRWFDRWLKDDRTAPELPPVQYYVLNSSQWKTANAWPPPGGHPVKLLLSSGGHANSAAGDGRLRAQATSGEAADEFVDDPAHPVPSLGGSCCSHEVSREQSGIEARQDVLVYTSEPFVQTTRIVGDVNVTLSMSSSAPDTDLMVKLLEVDASGHAYNLTDTAVRMRYRNGYDSISLMQPGKAYTVKLTGLVTATDFLPGHRLRIEVAGTNFPNYERNLHTGGRNFDESVAHTARNRLLHDGRNASFVEFATLPIEAAPPAISREH